MSNGRCGDNCRGSYVFAVLQGTNCYCSNYIPSDQVSTSSCNSPCPGYPSDLCGNPDAGLFAYIALGGTPSGTSGGDGTTTRTSPVSTSQSIRGTSLRSLLPATPPPPGSSTPVTTRVSMLTSPVTSQSSAEPTSTSVAQSTDSESVSASPSSSSVCYSHFICDAANEDPFLIWNSMDILAFTNFS